MLVKTFVFETGKSAKFHRGSDLYRSLGEDDGRGRRRRPKLGPITRESLLLFAPAVRDMRIQCKTKLCWNGENLLITLAVQQLVSAPPVDPVLLQRLSPPNALALEKTRFCHSGGKKKRRTARDPVDAVCGGGGQ